MSTDAESPDSIETERLVLRPWRENEAARLLDIRTRPDVAKWLADPTPWTDIAVAEQAIGRWRDAFSSPLGVRAITLKHATSSVPLGSVSLGRLPDSEEIEIGWYLHPDSGGNGYAVEAARAVLELALGSGIPRVWAVMWPHNDPSARVASSIGMTDLGAINDPWYGTEAEPTSRIFRAGRSPSDRP